MTDDLIARLRAVAIRPDIGELGLFEAADALEAQARRIAELEEEWEDLEEKTGDIHLRYYEQIKTLYARIAELEAALKPFSDKAKVFHDYVDDYPIMFGAEPPLRVGDIRAARAAYLGEKE